MVKSDEYLLKKQQVKCNDCGGKIQIPITNYKTYLTCEFCNSSYEFNPSTLVISKLIFEDELKQKFEIKIADNLIIARDDEKGYLCVKNESDQSLSQSIPIRNRFISRKQHARLEVRKEFSYVSGDQSKRIVTRKKCLIEDCSSSNGTAVNGHMLKPNERMGLISDMEIILAPLSPVPLKVLFKESVGY